ncbi:hypothetical protein [Pseudoalteromonas luteoviolacea]|uniref:Uncharacterized protein n=1 Tax=Pseudoalteromonas luteoviolacea NCIMB 1942 TaxID=1365253 RepID=A0A167FVY0_9GAMM|nr:hypothetical protein [Pseudoalteromonas luteoviolacea]KZN53055.1 hypothetical protein N482_25040 [Pseudoalteromonas luteoviolacea NCIMB 1942]KZW99197.1 hypothetical protein JL49_18645 [Pseudoalteromonas luteoviolacea]
MTKVVKFIFFIVLFLGVEVHIRNDNSEFLTFKLSLANACSYSNEYEEDDDCAEGEDDDIEIIEVLGEEIEEDWDDDWGESEFEEYLEELIEEIEEEIERQKVLRCEREALEGIDDCVSDLKDEIGYAADACYITATVAGGVTGVYFTPLTGVVIGGLSATGCWLAKIYDMENAPGECTDDALEEAENCN